MSLSIIGYSIEKNRVHAKKFESNFKCNPPTQIKPYKMSNLEAYLSPTKNLTYEPRSPTVTPNFVYQTRLFSIFLDARIDW